VIAQAAVKIDPVYDGPVIHVLDASRSVPVASELINTSTRNAFKEKTKKEYEGMRKDHASRQELKNYISLPDARKNKVSIDWSKTNIVKPAFLGRKELVSYPLSEIANYIDWTPFFQTWMLAGRYPKIFEDKVVGHEAKKLFEDAQEMLASIIKDKSLQANGVVAFYPCWRNETDDVTLFDETGNRVTPTHATRHGKRYRYGVRIEEMLIVHKDEIEIVSNFPVKQITVVDPIPGYGDHVK